MLEDNISSSNGGKIILFNAMRDDHVHVSSFLDGNLLLMLLRFLLINDIFIYDQDKYQFMYFGVFGLFLPFFYPLLFDSDFSTWKEHIKSLSTFIIAPQF